MTEIKPGIYKHFKGDTIEVIGTALHSETQEGFVIYRHLTGPHKDEKHYWVRPVSMFNEIVERDGMKKQRFTFISDK